MNAANRMDTHSVVRLEFRSHFDMLDFVQVVCEETGQLVGLVVMGALGFIPGYAMSAVMKATGTLRVPRDVEIMGLDLVEVPIEAYPEGMTRPAVPVMSPLGTGTPAAVPAE